MVNLPSWILRARGPILLLGETGTGKSTFAKVIHDKVSKIIEKKYMNIIESN